MNTKVTIYSDPNDTHCADVEKFLKNFELDLQVHDIRTAPLNSEQLLGLVKHFDLEHFLNYNFNTTEQNYFEKSSNHRQEIIDLIAKDNRLLRKPIIVSGQLMTVGWNYDSIIEMLQIKDNISSRDRNDNFTEPKKEDEPE